MLTDFDYLMDIHWVTNDIVSLVANVLQLLFFIGVSASFSTVCRSNLANVEVFQVYAFTWYLTDERLDAHHKAHARGDIAILFGCCAVLFVKLVGEIVDRVVGVRYTTFSDRLTLYIHKLPFTDLAVD